MIRDLPIDLPALEPGWVWLVGAGPGEPGLLSLLGAHASGRPDPRCGAGAAWELGALDQLGRAAAAAEP